MRNSRTPPFQLLVSFTYPAHSSLLTAGTLLIIHTESFDLILSSCCPLPEIPYTTSTWHDSMERMAMTSGTQLQSRLIIMEEPDRMVVRGTFSGGKGSMSPAQDVAWPFQYQGPGIAKFFTTRGSAPCHEPLELSMRGMMRMKSSHSWMTKMRNTKMISSSVA